MLPDQSSKYFLQSLAKGLRVLQIIAQSPGSIGISEIARRLGTNNATITSREALLADLEMVRTRGYAANEEELSVGLRSVAME